MIERPHGLSADELLAVAELERQVVAADGGRLKLEWGTLAARSGNQVEDLLWWDDGRLLGFVGLYAFGPSLELSGMVAPQARRRGTGGALLDAALALARERGRSQALLVVPRPSAAGRALALSRGGVLDHSEHALVLSGPPPDTADNPRVGLRDAVAADAPLLSELLEAAFGYPPSRLAERLASPTERTLVVELDGEPVGTVMLTRDGEDGGVYGFVVDPAWQGRGVGRDVLRRVCRQLLDDGARCVGLEVAVDNPRALGLYTSVGFTEVTTEDYYALRCPG